MNRIFFSANVVALLVCSALATPLHAEPSVVGLWEQADDHGRVQAWFNFSEKNGVYSGAIAKAFPAQGEKSEELCSKCPGDQKNAPFIGLVIVDGMQRKGLSYENGTILDPRDGSVYRAVMEISPDGQRLMVRGYLGVKMLGQTQVWRRLPDSAMPTTGSSPTTGKRPSGGATKPE
jgi:uncharacterized protein (DUF2147 family)